MRTFWNTNRGLHALDKWEPNCWVQVTCPTQDDIDYLENAIDEFEELREQIENIVQDLYRFQAQYNAHNPDNRFYLPDSLKLDNRNIVSGQYDMNTIRGTVERLNDYHTALFTADDPHTVEY